MNNKRSFTLIELIISIGLLGLIMTLTAGTLISVINSYRKQAMIAEVERNGDLVIRRIEELTRTAQIVECVSYDSDAGLMPASCSDTDISQEVFGKKYFLKVLDNKSQLFYVGVTPATACDSDGNLNKYVYIHKHISGGFDGIPDSNDALTNSQGAGVNVSSFVLTVSNSTPVYLSAELDIEGSLCETLYERSEKLFNLFVTVRGTY